MPLTAGLSLHLHISATRCQAYKEHKHCAGSQSSAFSKPDCINICPVTLVLKLEN